MQRSGTNIVKALLEENFDVRVLNLILGSKHLPFDAAAAGSWTPRDDVKRRLGLAVGELEEIREAFRIDSIGCTLIIKEPFAWLRSLHRYRQIRKKGPIPFDASFIANNLTLWIERNAEWLEELPKHFRQRCTIISYADLLARPADVLHEHEIQLCLVRRRHQLLTDLPFAARAGADKHRGANILTAKTFNRNYYVKRRYMDEYPADARHLVQELLRCAPESVRRYAM